MAKCKLDRCSEAAVSGPWRKRYCAEHGARYLEKQRAYAKIAATLPACASGIAPDCTGKLSVARHEAGDDVCLQCQRRGESLAAEQYARYARMASFENAETVHELKEWIKEYML